MSVRLLKKVLKEQEEEERQLESDHEQEEDDDRHLNAKAKINPFDLLNDDDDHQVQFFYVLFFNFGFKFPYFIL